MEPREAVIGRKSSEEAFGENGERFKFVAADGKSEDGQIDGGGAEALEENRGNFLDD